MKEIPLTRGFVALVDDKDFELVSQFKWYAHQAKKTWYARQIVLVVALHNMLVLTQHIMLVDARHDRTVAGKKQRIYLHRFLKNADAAHDVDHRDGNGLNDQRDNLRECPSKCNQRNKKKANLPKATSKYKGVKKVGACRWSASITVDNHYEYLGTHTDEEAAKAYDEAAIQFHGEYACLNFAREVNQSDASTQQTEVGCSTPAYQRDQMRSSEPSTGVGQTTA